MKKKTKIVLGIAALCFLGLFWGNEPEAKEESAITTEQQPVATVHENKATEIIVVNTTKDVLNEPDLKTINTLIEQPETKKTDDSETNIDEKPVTGSNLEVHYIDVGQGDATLIVCGDEAMLVDAGDDSKGTAIQLYLRKRNISKLKYVVATHPDADHIGGLDVIIYKYDCGQVLIPNCANDTSAYGDMQDSMRIKGYMPHVVEIGEKYTLGDAEIEILSPSTEFTFAETNDSSIVFRLDHGENSFLFTGDVTIPPQQALIYDPDLNIDVDVLKVPHHGANSAYIKGFYDEVSPQYAVISCGRGNRYGHPRQEVLDDLRNRGAKLFRTDEQGTIIAVSDGMTISFNTEPSTTWLPGEYSDTEISRSDSAAVSQGDSQHNNSEPPEAGITYVYNKNTKKFHYPGCSSVTDMKQKNRMDLTCTREELLEKYPNAVPCKRCKP